MGRRTMGRRVAGEGNHCYWSSQEEEEGGGREKVKEGTDEVTGAKVPRLCNHTSLVCIFIVTILGHN